MRHKEEDSKGETTRKSTGKVGVGDGDMGK